MLTKKEIRGILEVTNDYHRARWGHKDTGLWPAGVVAQLRGVVFVEGRHGEYRPASEKDDEIANRAFKDVMEFTEFDSALEYGYALAEEGPEFLKRFVKPQMKG